MTSGNSSSGTWGTSGGSAGEMGTGQQVVSVLFPDARGAEAAVRELRARGVPAEDISLITRNEDRNNPPEGSGMGGVAREEIGDEGLTYRASSELPNDEDLPTTQAQMTGRDVPVVTDFEVPPDEPLGGSDRLGLSRDADMIRRPEADTNADADIYTDFPDQPGGVNPDAPAADAGLQQEPMRKRVDPAGTAVAGAGIGGLAGLLIGAASLVIPGVGPFIAAGPIAAALGGMVAGSAAGSIIGALSAVGVPEEYARDYAARIEEGQCLVSVRTTPANRAVVEQVLNRG